MIPITDTSPPTLLAELVERANDRKDAVDPAAFADALHRHLRNLDHLQQYGLEPRTASLLGILGDTYPSATEAALLALCSVELLEHIQKLDELNKRLVEAVPAPAAAPTLSWGGKADWSSIPADDQRESLRMACRHLACDLLAMGVHRGWNKATMHEEELLAYLFYRSAINAEKVVYRGFTIEERDESPGPELVESAILWMFHDSHPSLPDSRLDLPIWFDHGIRILLTLAGDMGVFGRSLPHQDFALSLRAGRAVVKFKPE